MVQTALSEVQTAIYNVLVPSGTLDAQLAALNVTGVFDEVPENQAFDYISFGPTTEGPQNTLGRRGYLMTVQMDIWSNQLGFKNAQAILARMNTLLDQKTLSLASQSHVYTMYDQAQEIKDPAEGPAGPIRHIPVRYKIFSQE